MKWRKRASITAPFPTLSHSLLEETMTNLFRPKFIESKKIV